MPVTIGSNIASLRASRQLGKVTSELSDTYTKLSSGQRINKASDDAAGVAVAMGLTNNQRVFTQGVRNLSDGISMLNIADGAIEQLSSIAIRLKELAEQAANGTYTYKQRNAINKEAQALSREYVRVAQSTTFNGQLLLNGSLREVRIQAGYGIAGGIQSGMGGTIGTGTFAAARTYDMQTPGAVGDMEGRDIAIGDVNRDGIPDLITNGVLDEFSVPQIAVRFGLGDGTFAAVGYYDETGIGDKVALGDVNNDNILDMLVGSFVNQIRLGQANGTFATGTNYTMSGVSFFDPVLSDINGDGNLDMLAGGTAGGAGAVSIRLGNGNGTFSTAYSYSAPGVGVNSLAARDMNDDGIPDLVTLGTTASGIRFGNGDGTFGAATSYTSSGLVMDIGDIDNDGNMDLAYTQGGAAVYVNYGTGGGRLGTATTYSYSGNQRAVTIGDVNGDGNSDLISASYGGVSIALSRGGRQFGTASSYVTPDTVTIAVAASDLNLDGVLDIISTGNSNADPVTTSVALANTTSGVSSLLPFDLTSRPGALSAMTEFDRVLTRLSQQRGTIGSFQSRIGVAQNALQASSDNYAAAFGRIQDADVAYEAAHLVRSQILQRAGANVLSQANQQVALALLLLNDS